MNESTIQVPHNRAEALKTAPKWRIYTVCFEQFYNGLKTRIRNGKVYEYTITCRRRRPLMKFKIYPRKGDNWQTVLDIINKTSQLRGWRIYKVKCTEPEDKF